MGAKRLAGGRATARLDMISYSCNYRQLSLDKVHNDASHEAAGRNLQRNLKATTLRFPQRCTAAGAGPGHCECHPALKIEAAEQSTAKTTRPGVFYRKKVTRYYFLKNM
jgi:hypothetical protein